MIFAYDEADRKIHINDYVSGPIFCPDGHPLIAKRGEVRSHHFSHKSGCDCRFSNGMTDWHINFQNRAPVENQEIRLKVDKKLHIADVLVGKYVIEYQHSPISREDVKDREEFYTSLGYTLVWVFDTSSWSYTLNKKGSSLVLKKTRGPDFPLLGSCTLPVIKILDFGKKDLFIVDSQKGTLLTGHTINMVDFDKVYLSIENTSNDIRPFHHGL
jgi:competence CoiA-like predicted nuclease